MNNLTDHNIKKTSAEIAFEKFGVGTKVKSRKLNSEQWFVITSLSPCKNFVYGINDRDERTAWCMDNLETWDVYKEPKKTSAEIAFEKFGVGTIVKNKAHKYSFRIESLSPCKNFVYGMTNGDLSSWAFDRLEDWSVLEQSPRGKSIINNHKQGEQTNNYHRLPCGTIIPNGGIEAWVRDSNSESWRPETINIVAYVGQFVISDLGAKWCHYTLTKPNESKKMNHCKNCKRKMEVLHVDFCSDQCTIKYIEKLETKTDILERFTNDIAEHDCTYGDNCPTSRNRLGKCVGCQARDAIDVLMEAGL